MSELVSFDKAYLITDDWENSINEEGNTEGWQGKEEKEAGRVVIAGDLLKGKVHSASYGRAEDASDKLTFPVGVDPV